MVKRYIYVDTENVYSKEWVPQLKHLTPTDTLVLPYTDNSSKICIEDIEFVKNCKASIKTVYVAKSAHNALDFVLVCCLARQSQTASKSRHYVISHDKGFDASVAYLNSLGLRVERRHSIEKIDRVATERRT